MPTHFPNRDELSLRRVLALPNPSRIGFAIKIFPSTPVLDPAIAAMSWRPAVSGARTTGFASPRRVSEHQGEGQCKIWTANCAYTYEVRSRIYRTLLGRFSFTGTRLAGNNDGLELSKRCDAVVGVVRDGEHVRREF